MKRRKNCEETPQRTSRLLKTNYEFRMATIQSCQSHFSNYIIINSLTYAHIYSIETKLYPDKYININFCNNL